MKRKINMTKEFGLSIGHGGNITGAPLVLVTVVSVLPGTGVVLAGKRREEGQASP
jgi:hypothetical protein